MFEHNYGSRRDYNASHYDVSQVCLNGHVITDRYNGSPQLRKDFCDQCGAKTIKQCPNCGKDIQGGDYIVSISGVTIAGMTPAPGYCHNCGQPFPWTTARLEVAQQTIREMDDLGDKKDELANSLPDLAVETPKTDLAVLRWKRVLGSVGTQSALAIREVLVAIASEAVKKALFP